MMQRFSVSWYTKDYERAGIDNLPFQAWTIAFTEDKETVLSGVVEATSEDAVWRVVEQLCPDYRVQRIERVGVEWRPKYAFPTFENRTSLTFESEAK
jgi:hypothetical protein